MKAAIRSIGTAQTAGVRYVEGGFEPTNPGWIGILVDVYLGPEDGPGEELFQVSVCSPSYLAFEATEFGTKWLKSYILMPVWDFAALRCLLQDLCDRSEGRDWNEVGWKLSRYMDWEYEDYQPSG